MKFVVLAQDFKRALNTCNDVAPASSSIADEMTGVLIRTEEDGVVVMSSGDNVSVRRKIPATIIKEGEVVVHCGAIALSVDKTFQDVDFDGKKNEVKVETTSKSTLKVLGSNRSSEGKCQNHVRNFTLMAPKFFAETLPFDVSKSTDFPAFQFMDGLSRVGHAASKDNSKLHFNCISLTLTDSEVVFAATDGIQIAEFRTAAEVKGLRGSFILGLKFASMASKLVNPKLDVVKLYVEKDNLLIQSGQTTLVGALLNTQFPEYTPYLTTEGKKLAMFSREDVLQVLQSVQPTADAKTHRLVIDAESSGEAMFSTASVAGEAKSSGLAVETPENFTLHFDSVLLQDSIRQLKSDEFEFYFAEGAKGVLLKSPKDDDFKAFVCTLKKLD